MEDDEKKKGDRYIYIYICEVLIVNFASEATNGIVYYI